MKTKTSKLWLKSTSWIPDYEAMALCRAALESVERSLLPGEKLQAIKVKLTNCRYGYRGRAHWTEWERIPGQHSKQWDRILVRIGKPNKFPCDVNYWKFKDMPEFRFENYKEALVAVTAHEIGHTLGYSGRREGEFKCEMVAWDALDYYRKHLPEIEASIARARQESAQRTLSHQPPTTQEKAVKKHAQLEALLTKWTRRQRLAANKVKKYSRAVVRSQRRVFLKGSAASSRCAEPLTPAAPSSTALAALMPPASLGPSQPAPGQ